jgi:hypothetical protein
MRAEHSTASRAVELTNHSRGSVTIAVMVKRNSQHYAEPSHQTPSAVISAQPHYPSTQTQIIMQLDIVMQVVFGTFATLIGLVGIWFAWHTYGGKSLWFLQGLYPTVPTILWSIRPYLANALPARNVPSQRTNESLLPTHRYHASPEGRYLTNTILHHTF